jgi:hypothetical protein
MKKFIILFALISILFASTAMAAQKTLVFSWNQTISTDFAGWKLYRATAPSVQVTPANLVATITYDGTVRQEYQSTQAMTAPDGVETTWYFVLTAFDNSANESAKSNEVSVVIDFGAPVAPFTFKVTVQSN